MDGSLKINGSHIVLPGRSISHWEQTSKSTEPIVVGMGGTDFPPSSLKVMERMTTPTLTLGRCVLPIEESGS